MNKKLVYILNHYSNNSVQHFYHVLNLLSSIASKGIEITLVIEKCEDAPHIENSNIHVICQKEENGLQRAFELYRILRRLVGQGYKKIFTRISYNSAIISIVVGKIHRAETYYWLSGTTLDLDKGKNIVQRFNWLLSSYTRLWIIKKFIDHFVTGPESMVNYYVKELEVSPNKMLMLYNDINLERFRVVENKEKIEIRNELKLNPNELIILMVHRLSPVRRTDKYLPEILNDDFFINNSVRVLIIGEGPERRIIEEKVQGSLLANRIEFLGSKPNYLIEKYYMAADIFINPSYTEGFPRVLLEAMACGLPIVATDAGGTMDIFGSRQKDFIVSKEDVDLFKHVLKKVIIETSLRLELSRENSERVSEFSTDKVSEMYIREIFYND